MSHAASTPTAAAVAAVADGVMVVAGRALADDDDDEWASVQRELRLLRKGGVSLVRECKLAAVVGVEAAAREEAARAAARLRRFAGSEGTALLREVTE